MLGFDLFSGGKKRVGTVRALPDADGNIAGIRLDPQNGTGEDLVFFGGEALKNHAALCFANPLNDDLLCRLCGNSPKGLRLDFHIHEVTELCFLVNLVRRIQRDLRRGADHIFYDFLLDIHPHGLLI